MKTTNQSVKLQLRCLPGSARIEVTALGIGRVMFDPDHRVWHRAGQAGVSPAEFIRRWGLGRVESLITRLLRHEAKRRESYQRAQP